MALVQSDVSNEKGYKEAIQLLRGALVDELSATNLYEKLMDLIPQYADILNEIKNDEINHQGRLLALILSLGGESQLEHFNSGLDQKE